MKDCRRLNWKSVTHLCRRLGTSPAELKRICEDLERHYRRKPKRIKGKIRQCSTPQGRLRQILDRLQNILQGLEIPDYIHGGIRGRSIETNARPHVGQAALLKADIEKFFPSIAPRMVYRMFRDQLSCSPDVAHHLTRLTTLDGSLPIGSPTSTIVGSLVALPMAARLKGLASTHRAAYSQFVDDIAISGARHVARLGATVQRIIRQSGFKANCEKWVFSSTRREERVVTGIRIDGRFDAPSVKIRETRNLIKKLVQQRNSGQAIQDRQIRSLEGKIRHVSRFNRGAGRHLHKRLNRAIV